MTSVLGKIKDLPHDSFPQKFQLSCLKNNIFLLFDYFFKLKMTNRPFFRILWHILFFSGQKNKIKSFVDILNVLKKLFLICEKRSIRLKRWWEWYYGNGKRHPRQSHDAKNHCVWQSTNILFLLRYHPFYYCLYGLR